MIKGRGITPPGFDCYKAKAAQFFKVPYDKVTPEQRAIGKRLAFQEVYGIKSRYRV